MADPRRVEAARLREDARAIFDAGVAAVDPHRAVTRFLECFDRGGFRRVLAVGAGKGSARMGLALEEAVGAELEGGVIAVKDGYTADCRVLELLEASHPVPDERGLEAARRIAAVAEEADEDTLLVVLISGGGSALLPMPCESLTLAHKQAVTELLLAAGADIGEINAVRKHLSALKGGQLARLAAPATVLTLCLSDVIGDDPSVIASGPTVADPSTYADARAVLERYRLWQRVPEPVRLRIEGGIAGAYPETPKPGDPALRGARLEVVGGNAIALSACADHARSLGYETLILASTVEGEAREVARMHAAIAGEISRFGRPAAAPACVISGGETTVTVRGVGRGGRNQEFALAAAFGLAGRERLLVMSAGTDGTDGPTDAAGAIVTGDTLSRAARVGLDPRRALDENDAYPLFDALGDLVRTGPTGTNVMDVHLIMVG